MGVLSIVATPIGNLEDITLRALRTLKECTVIYAEDTRVTSKLLARYEIKKPVQRLDAITELKKAEEILVRLEAGEHVAFVSDAGTPGISDPGSRLIAAIRSRVALGEVGQQITIEAIPGPSALTAALSISGLGSDGFTFVGFLPHKKGRQTALKRIKESDIPVVLYESPHRILKLLKELEDRSMSRVSIARELTKIHEEVISGNIAEVQTYFTDHPDHIRGEFVVIIEAKRK